MQSAMALKFALGTKKWGIKMLTEQNLNEYLVIDDQTRSVFNLESEYLQICFIEHAMTSMPLAICVNIECFDDAAKTKALDEAADSGKLDSLLYPFNDNSEPYNLDNILGRESKTYNLTDVTVTLYRTKIIDILSIGIFGLIK